MKGNVVQIGAPNQPSLHEWPGAEASCALKIRAAWFKSEFRAEHVPLIDNGRAIVASGAADRATARLEQVGRTAEVAEVRKALMLLVAAFPNAARTDLTAFGAALALDIVALQPSTYAIHAACQTLRRRARWLPTIAEVVDAIAGAEAELAAARRSLRELPSMIGDLEARAAQARSNRLAGPDNAARLRSLASTLGSRRGGET